MYTDSGQTRLKEGNVEPPYISLYGEEGELIWRIHVMVHVRINSDTGAREIWLAQRLTYWPDKYPCIITCFELAVQDRNKADHVSYHQQYGTWHIPHGCNLDIKP